MKKNNNKNGVITEDKKQTATPTKKNTGKYKPPEKTEATDATVNTSKQTTGFNEERTTREDLLPPD